MQKHIVLALVVVGVGSLGSPDRVCAQPDSYGLEIAASDAASATVFFAGSGFGTSALEYTGLGLYLLGGPLIHALHGRLLVAGESALWRLGGPAVLGGAGLLVTRWICDHRVVYCPGFAVALGVGLGSLTAMIVDAAVLASPDDERMSLERTPAMMIRIGGSF